MRARRDAAPGLQNRQLGDREKPSMLRRSIARSHGNILKVLHLKGFFLSPGVCVCLTLEELKNSL
ncbi:hypothetical protein [Ancylobacter sp. FA202]|uniref:hypothetical protein n=1 Tax=Ancylobacter sp. FA202 TaxID=1111106 RepID=UPI0012DCACF1|nr:hypothetical protein [Ancylobacter sp. FA202]